ncbi:hypothetical protein V499_08367 [Pseudogymnoascus sp. VKM F-103]|uniref:MARVEL domain-containing protein n=1 Tax=Pseudogymnoascus verrucosus TaxID=342668 RepID=A0A1B8GT16_9PEZI|nr:uncharacterized protein VE01_02441 [Pseudogymnoascus verrucosus]KFY71415.1 hypothetical protein V499_08367 [Pseudogymnoascus sp. VKM F-103]OBT98984.2 hypothetical protein VE01_02441 [Pseudogymnoascus verrucosus]
MMDLAETLLLPVRAVQALFAIIVLGLLADVTTNWYTASEVNFLIFASVWTLLAVAYLVIAPLTFPAAAHKHAILVAEALTMLFWFAGFIALADLLGKVGCTSRQGKACGESIGGTVFAAFEWLLFLGTTALAALHVFRTRGGSSEPAHAMKVQPTPYQGA